MLGVIEGLVLVVAYELATTVLHPYGTRGIVLTALAAFVLAAAKKGATLAGQWEPHRECSVAASGCGGIVGVNEHSALRAGIFKA